MSFLAGRGYMQLARHYRDFACQLLFFRPFGERIVLQVCLPSQSESNRRKSSNCPVALLAFGFLRIGEEVQSSAKP